MTQFKQYGPWEVSSDPEDGDRIAALSCEGKSSQGVRSENVHLPWGDWGLPTGPADIICSMGRFPEHF